jgi:DNA-binding MarR family transcriptional regulator
MEHIASPEQLTARLRDGFERIALVLRADLWAAAGDNGLNPTQAQVLALLSARAAGLRAKDIALHLAVSAASIADTLAALERKALVTRTTDPDDARAVQVRATPEGIGMGRIIADAGSKVAQAIATLPPSTQADLLLAQIAVIRQLQLAGAIPVQRMCVSCSHFRPRAHPGEAKPHHCAFVNAAFGDRDLRLDCGDHEPAEPSRQAATWRALTDDGSATLQAEP